MTENKPDATGTPIYLKCPQCGCDQFTEFAKEETRQDRVRLTNTGDRDYENAGNVNIDGDYVEVIGYTCQECGAKYIFSEGMLVKSCRSFWMSWWYYLKDGEFTFDFPWWESKPTEEKDSVAYICAAVRAESEDAAKELVRTSYTQPPERIEWRSCKEKPAGWSPFCDQFPQGFYEDYN